MVLVHGLNLDYYPNKNELSSQNIKLKPKKQLNHEENTYKKTHTEIPLQGIKRYEFFENKYENY